MINLYNSLTHKKEELKTHEPGVCTMYTCGPTVYHFAHIGNLRSYIMEDVLEKYINSYQKNDYYRWAIIEKNSGECIGQIAYFLVDNKNNFAEIEYCIGSDFQCKGYATEATKAVIKYGFNKINLHKVQICTKTINKPSKRVIEKCGFTYEGTLRDYFYMDGEYVGRLYFSMLKSEFESKQN